MAHDFLPAKVPVGFAHRGGTDVAPENTDGSFAHAVAIGYTYLELDVHLSADGEVVVWHDDTLTRVAGIDRAIVEMTWSELAEVRVGGDFRVVRLADLLDRYPTARFNIEPKHDDVIEPLVGVLQDADAIRRVCIGSFSDKRISMLRDKLGPDLCTSAGPIEIVKTLLACYLYPSFRPKQQCVQIPIRAYGIPLDRAGLINRLQRMGQQVHYWTINDETEMVRLLDAGADGIMTDNIKLLKAVLESRGHWDVSPRS